MTEDKLTIKSWARSNVAPETKHTVGGSFKENLGPSTITFNWNRGPIMTIHPDGRITLGDDAKPTEAAAQCIEAMGHMIQNMIDLAVQAERDQIVAWLRDHFGDAPEYDAIEAREHLK